MRFFYGRKKVRALSENQDKLITEILPKYAVSKDTFKNKRIRLEIGFGTGDFLSGLVRSNPDIQFIGCEPFINGMISLLQKIKDEAPKNLCITTENAQEFVEKILDETLEAAYIMFPDPWPKKRHNKRRLIQKGFMEKLANKIQKDGNLYIATDHPKYAEWIQEELAQVKLFKKSQNFKRPSNWPQSKYEKKEKCGKPQYFCYIK